MKQKKRIEEFEWPENPKESGFQGQSDSTVWDSFRSGNESAFIFIYETYFDSLFEFGRMFCSNENLVKDAVQDLFIDLRKSRENLSTTNNIKFYLFKSLKRRVVKDQKSWYNKLLELKDDYSFTVSFSHEQLLVDRQLNEEQIKKLNKAVQQLSTRKKEVIYFFYYECLSYEEIRQLMGLSHVKSVRNLLYKALDFLKSEISRI